MSGFAIDLDELLGSVDEMARCEAALDVLLDDLARQVHTLHATWTGAAATAQRLAQAEWESGCHDLRSALERLRAAAAIAHDNYSLAVASNVRMWEQVQ